MNNIKNILGPLGSIAAAVGVMSTVAGSAMSVARPLSVHVSVHVSVHLLITSV